MGKRKLAQKSGSEAPGNNPGASEPEPKKFRAFCLTLWTDEQLEYFKKQEYRYLCYAPEICPDTEKFHWQAYVYFNNQRSLEKLWKDCPDCRIKPANGTGKENRQYIFGPYNKNGKYKPENPDAEEYGELPRQGTGAELVAFRKAIQEGKRGDDLSVDFLEIRAKFPKLEPQLTYEEDHKRAKRQYLEGMVPEVHVRWGEPGTGKSRYVYETHGIDNVYEFSTGDGAAGSVWWSGYSGQEVIVLNDFDGEIKYKYFLRFLDRYPFHMQTKGGHCWRLCKYIYITSNHPPHMWYPQHHDTYQALERRFTSITEVK